MTAPQAKAARPRYATDLRRVLHLFFSQRAGALWLGAALATVTALMGMALLGLSGWFIAATALAGAQAASAIVFDVFMPSAGIRLLALGRTASRYGERLVTHDATLAVTAALRERLFRGWAAPDAAQRLLMRPSRLLFRLTGDIDALESVYLRLLVPAVAAAGTALACAIAFAMVQPWFGLALFAWLMLAGGGIAWATASRARHASARRGQHIETLRARAVDLVAGQTELLMAGRLQAQCDALAAAEQRLAQAEHALNRLELRAGLGWGLASAVTLAAVLLAAGALASRGVIGAPGAALLLLLALTAMEPFAALRRGALEAGRTWLAIRRIAPRLVAAEGVGLRELPLPPDGMAVRLQGVGFTHAGTRHAALHAIDLQLMHGERVAIVGPSGAGKSSLMALIAGEVAASTGAVQAVAACWLTQRTELFQDSVRANLQVAAPEASDERLWHALAQAGLADDIRATRAGLATRLGEGGLGLSGGQARRLALARLLLREVPLWLLDEATEGLDGAAARSVLGQIDHLSAARAVVIVTHLQREAALADRLLCMAQGRLVADLKRGTREFEERLAALRQDGSKPSIE